MLFIIVPEPVFEKKLFFFFGNNRRLIALKKQH